MSANCEEATLLRLARLGGYLGEQARTQLVQQQYSWILASCRQTLRNEADAADAAQEAALAMFRALPGFEGRSALRTWLHRIVRNACVSLIRKRQRHAMTEHIESLLEIHVQQCLAPDKPDSEVVASVRQVLANMNDKSREVLQLRFFNDVSLEDISQTLGIGLSATKMRLYRAMEQFRQQHSALLCPAVH
ncbi:MAG: RNA polymerase sigma factor [Pseudomonadales bacterium]